MALHLGELTLWMNANTTGFDQKVDRSVQKLDKFAASARKAAAVATAALAAIGAAGGYLIKVASDAEELDNVIDQAFGHMSHEINAWAKDTGRAMGRSTHQMREYAGVTQAMLKPILNNADAAAKMAKEMATLAVDMGSFWNVADEDAFEALRSGIVGMVQPLRRFGIDLSVATLEAWALEKGIKANVATMSDAEKMMLRWQFIMDRTTMVQGDAVRNIGSVANMTKALGAEVRNIAEDYGTLLLPVWAEVLKNLRDAVLWFGNLDEKQRRQIVQWGAVAAAVLGGVVAFGMIVSAVALAAKAFALLAGAWGSFIAPVLLGLGVLLIGGTALYAAWDQDWGGIRSKLAGLWETLDPIVDAARELGHETLKTMWDWVVGGLDQLSYVVDDAWPLIQSIPATIVRTISWVVNGLADLAEGAALAVTKAVTWTIDIVRGAWQVATEWVDKAITWTISTARGVFTVASEWVDRAVTWTVDTAKGAWGVASEWLDKAVTWIVSTARGVFAVTSEWVDRAVTWTVNTARGVWTVASEWVDRGITWTINTTRGVWEIVSEWADRAIRWTVDTAKGAWAIATEWLSKVVTWTIHTVAGALDIPAEWVDKAITWTVDTVKGAWEITSEWIDRVVEWTVNTAKGSWEVASEWVDRAISWVVDLARGSADAVSGWFDVAVTWIVNLAQGTADAVSGWFNVALTWFVNLAQGVVGTVSDWVNRVVTWFVDLTQGTIGAVSNWIDNTVLWVVNLVKGSAQAVSDWISPKLEWVARLVNVVAGAGNAASEWLLNLVGGKGKPVEVDVPVKPTILEGWGTNLNNWLSTTLEGLQWQEITKEQFDKLTEEYGEQASEMLKQIDGKHFVRTSEKIQIMMDMALGVGTFLAGRSILAVGSAAFGVIQKALKTVLGAFLGDVVAGWAIPVAVAAAITWTLIPEDFKEKVRSLFGTDLQSSVREAFPDVAQLVDDQQLTDITNLVVKYADAYGFAKDQVAALVKQESDFRDVGNSLSTAVGPLQITQTALNDLARLGIDYDVSTLEGRVEAAVKYLQVLRDHYKLTGDELIAAYYAGPTYIKKHGITDDVIFGQISPRQYVDEWKAELAKLDDAAHIDLSKLLKTGANVYVGLQVAHGAGAALWASLQGVLSAAGFVTTGLKSLGMPGVIAAMSVSIAIYDAIDEGNVKALVLNIVAALTAAMLAAGFTGGNITAGVLTFTVALNMNLGELLFGNIGEDAKKVWQQMEGWRAGRIPISTPALIEDVRGWALMRWLEDKLKGLGFQTGTPWTGSGPLNEVAGVVHKQEAVIPYAALKKGPAGVLEFLGVPGFQAGLPRNITTGNTQIDAMLASTGGWLDSLNETISAITDTIKTVFVNFFTWLGELLVTIAKSFLSEEQFAALENAFNSLKERVQGIVDAWSGKETPSTAGGMGNFRKAVDDFLKAQVEAQKPWWKKLFDNIKTQIEDINTEIKQADWSVEIQHVMSGVVDGLKSSTSEIAHTIAGMVDHIMLALNDWRQALSNVVSMMVSSLINLFADDYAKEFEKYGKRGNEAFDSFSTMLENYKNWDKNLDKLKELQRGIDEATVGGGIVGGILGLLLFGLPGLIVGAGAGAMAGRSAATSASAEEMEELRQKLEDTLAKIKEFLGTTINDIAGAVASAFSAANLSDFYSRLDQNLADIVRNAFINAFVASTLEPLITQLSDVMTQMVMSGQKLSDPAFGGAFGGILGAGMGDILGGSTWADVIKTLVSNIKEQAPEFYEILDELGLAFGDLSDSANEVTGALRNVPAGFKIALRRFEVAEPVPMASGGIVTRPTYALIGESGPEAVIPLDEQMGVSVTINVHGNVYADDLEKRIEDTVYRAAKRSRLGATGLAGGFA